MFTIEKTYDRFSSYFRFSKVIPFVHVPCLRLLQRQFVFALKRHNHRRLFATRRHKLHACRFMVRV